MEERKSENLRTCLYYNGGSRRIAKIEMEKNNAEKHKSQRSAVAIAVLWQARKKFMALWKHTQTVVRM